MALPGLPSRCNTTNKAMDISQDLYQDLIDGQLLDRETAMELLQYPKPEELYNLADKVRLHFHGNFFHLCSIINAKSGNCSENCRFCAQSTRHQTSIDAYESIEMEEALEIGRDNDTHGVHHLSLVTSGRKLTQETLEQLTPLYREFQKETSLHFCASTGLLSFDMAKGLIQAGVTRYHCNLETNESFFPSVCTTHTWQEKVQTLQTARKAGLSTCSGGIIGLGETMGNRISLAFELRQLGVRSIPINILTPIEGTPMMDLPPLAVDDILTTVALFRLINPEAVIRIAGGRQQLGPDQYRCFSSGANGAIVGNYLTTLGTGLEDDLQQLTAMGYRFQQE